MTTKTDRFFDPKDGTYANVPIIKVHPEIFRGKRPFDSSVLIGNWYEDRSKFKESGHRSRPFCRLDYPAHLGAVPDIVVRRKARSSKEKRPGRLLVDHHNIDQQKQFISSYDEQYNKRGAYGEFQDTSERKWALPDNHWLPERSDHPLEGPPTSWGLIEKKRAETQFLQRQRTMPNMSEYTNRYVPHRRDDYLASKRINTPRIYSSSVDRSASLTNNIYTRSLPFYNRRPPTAYDVIDIDHLASHRREETVPRAYFYLGSLPNHSKKKTQKTLSISTEPINTNQPVTVSIEQTPSQEETV